MLWGVYVSLRYVENPIIKAEDIAALRVLVGWDAREEKFAEIVGCTYLTSACYDGNLLVGYVDVLSDGVEDALIRNLVVHPAYQRKGIGLKLIRKVANRLKTDQIKTINVLFEPELTEFYKKAGFRIVKGGLIDNEKP